MIKAVITADIVDYSKLDKKQADRVLQVFYDLFGRAEGVRSNVADGFSIRRGDNVQVETEDPADALRIALMLKTAVNRISFDKVKKRKAPVDIRIAVGIGEVDAERDSVNISFGEAYLLSGRTLDLMKKAKRMIEIRTGDKETDSELSTELRLLEVIMNNWKITSADVLYWTLSGLDEKQVSEKLKISQPAVNQRKKVAGWNAVKALLKRYEELIEKIIGK